MINVTSTFLPNKIEFDTYLNQIWQNKYLTNRGDLVKQFEDNLRQRFNSDFVLATCNATIALQIAIESFVKDGTEKQEIITTPFSYIATTSSILWQKYKPVFVDIDDNSLTLSASEIENAITKDTAGVIATHVFGYPCETQIEEICKKHKIFLIFDAAQAIGTKESGAYTVNRGDASILSFHATKLVHTAEGGAIFCKTKENYDLMFSMHNFGHNGYEDINEIGINGKMSELNAAMGLTTLPYLDYIIKERRDRALIYKELLAKFDLFIDRVSPAVEWNYSYFPIFFESETTTTFIQSELRKEGYNARRYFYPSLNTLPFLKTKIKMPIAEQKAKTVLCLPLYHDLDPNHLEIISKIISVRV